MDALGLVDEEGGEAIGVRGSDDDPGAQTGAREFRGVLVGDEPAVLDGDDAVGDPGGFLGAAGGDEHGAALGGVAAQQAVQPGALAW